MRRDPRGIAIVLLSTCVGGAILIFALMAVLDLYNPPSDSRLGHQAMAVGAGAVAGAMSLIGVYIGMGGRDLPNPPPKPPSEVLDAQAVAKADADITDHEEAS